MRRLVLGAVWTLHLVFALLLVLQPHFAPTKKEHKTLIVKTIVPKLSPRPTIKSAVASSSQPKRTAPLPTPKVEAKKEAAKPIAPAKQAPKPAPVTKKEASKKKEPAIADKKIAKQKKPPTPKEQVEPRAKISDALLRELEESIAKIDQKPEKKTPPSKSAKMPSWTLQIDTSGSESTSSDESSYIDTLVSQLQQTLSLPDYGEVKIQLSLRQDGSIVKITVLRAQSQKNRRYLEETLPHLRFARFEGSLAQKKESDFIFTFVNGT